MAQTARIKLVLKDVKASAILISGCQDSQTSAAPFELDNSLFTDILLKAWNKGTFEGNYKKFL